MINVLFDRLDNMHVCYLFMRYKSIAFSFDCRDDSLTFSKYILKGKPSFFNVYAFYFDNNAI